MVIDPLGLTGKSVELHPSTSDELDIFVANFKRAEKEPEKMNEEKLRLLKELFRPYKEAKMRRKWDSVE